MEVMEEVVVDIVLVDEDEDGTNGFGRREEVVGDMLVNEMLD